VTSCSVPRLFPNDGTTQQARKPTPPPPIQVRCFWQVLH
jgi:hypothetical protein